MDHLATLLLLLFTVAFLYSSVGHGGASGYLAVMTLIGIETSMMKSSALVMNVAVSLIAFIGFYRAGYFKWKILWPFILTSVPLAYYGGKLKLSDPIYKNVLAVCLIISIIRFLYQFQKNEKQESKPVNIPLALIFGAIIGLISGMIGIGGGIILSPLLLLFNWGNIKETAAVSAPFIFLNSLAGLFGLIQTGGFHISFDLQIGLAATIIGGVLGSYFGSKKFNIVQLRYLLALGLVIASFKLMFLK